MWKRSLQLPGDGMVVDNFRAKGRLCTSRYSVVGIARACEPARAYELYAPIRFEAESRVFPMKSA